jgi:hypothetical protein
MGNIIVEGRGANDPSDPNAAITLLLHSGSIIACVPEERMSVPSIDAVMRGEGTPSIDNACLATCRYLGQHCVAFALELRNAGDEIGVFADATNTNCGYLVFCVNKAEHVPLWDTITSNLMAARTGPATGNQ